MINYNELIAEAISTAVESLSKDEIEGMLEIPTDEKMGDFAFPCFRLAKELRKAPPMIAKDIAAKLADNKIFAKVEAVNAYVNMFLSREEFIYDVIKEVISTQENFGRSDEGKGKKVIVEYSSPNIAKPFHIGHIRSTVIGNSIYKIYDFLGYDTERINHLGDYGTQFGKMIVSYRRWGNKEDVIKEPIKTLLNYYVKFHEECELDPSLEDEAREVFTKLENGEPEEVELWRWFREESLKEFSRVYKMLGIEFDSYAGESFYSDKMERVVNMLKDANLLKESEGAQIVDLEEYNMSPALIMKSDGSTLYITRDIAAAVYRKEHYNFHKNLYIVASQQNLHFKQWIKIIELMGNDWAKDVNTENVEETARQVGIGAVIFQELSNNRIKDYVFSWEKVLNFEGETGPYVQYTHTRAASLLRNAGEETAKKAMNVDALKLKYLSLIHISEPTRLGMISYAVFCLKKKKQQQKKSREKDHHKQKKQKKTTNNSKK